MKYFILITFTLFPIFAFAGNNTSLSGFTTTDTIISLSDACQKSGSTGFDGSMMNYEQLEFTGSSLYNSVYGFRKIGNLLYFVVLGGKEWDKSGSMVYTLDTAMLSTYNCRTKVMKKLYSWRDAEKMYYINEPTFANVRYVIIRNGAPEANVTDYTIVDIRRNKIILVSALPGIYGDGSFDSPLHNIHSLKVRGNTLMIYIDKGAHFSFALDTF